MLWRRGDSLEQAHARLAALAPDPSAQRAARDTVHPLLAEVEKLIPRPARHEFSLFMWAGWLEAQLVELPPQQAANAVTRRRFANQWSESNPRFRAAHAVASYLEREGVAPLSAGGTLYCDDREMLDPERDYWAAAGRRPLRCQAAPVGDVRLRPGNTARSHRPQPDRTQADASRARHAGDGPPRGVLPVPTRRRPAEADRTLGRRLPCRRAPRLHARVRRLAQDAGDNGYLTRPRAFRPDCSSCPQNPSPNRGFFPRCQGDREDWLIQAISSRALRATLKSGLRCREVLRWI
jgi:hypothetical protein